MLVDMGALGGPETGTDAIGAHKMSEKALSIDTDALDQVARESSLAIALVDEHSREVWTANNNSICRNLNPGGEFSPACARFCGKAFDKVREIGKPVGFVCHAGLDCRAVSATAADRALVAIVGRTFVKPENYRKATERAIIGDWRVFTPADFFENILLTGSAAVLNDAARRVRQLVAARPASAPERKEPPEQRVLDLPDEKQRIPQPVSALPKEEPQTPRSPDVSAWRSFFGSILKNDYPRAIDSLLQFVSGHYGLTDLIWLESRGDRFEHTAGLGEINNHKARLGLRPDDPRMIEAFRSEMPLELVERGTGDRVMRLFPIGVNAEVSAAIGTIDKIKSDEDKQHIARICHSISPQLEILRLRREAAAEKTRANAVSAFGESLKQIDVDDPWHSLTQKTAEILQAERASLLLFNDKTGRFDIKSLIGSTMKSPDDDTAGPRVAGIVFAKKEAVLVLDVEKTGLPPAPAERNYRTASFVSCPIMVGDRAIGVMSFTDRAGDRTFDKASVDLFQAIAPQLAVAIDHAALREKAGEFEQLSVTDPLTGLLNRRYIEARLLEEVRRSNRHGFPMSFMMLDVDSFKSYNDSFGHPAGDEALKMVGNVIRQTLRGADVAARFGGEEFAILLPQTTATEAAAIAERIRSNIQNARFPHRRVTASIGIASCSAELCASSDLIDAADRALYDAKRRGRNRVRAFEDMAILALDETLI